MYVSQSEKFKIPKRNFKSNEILHRPRILIYILTAYFVNMKSQTFCFLSTALLALPTFASPIPDKSQVEGNADNNFKARNWVLATNYADAIEKRSSASSAGVEGVEGNADKQLPFPAWIVAPSEKRSLESSAAVEEVEGNADKQLPFPAWIVAPSDK